MIVGLGMTAAPEMVYPDAGAAFAQGKSGERGNGGDRGRSGRGDEVSTASRGNSGQHGAKSENWVPPGQAKRSGADETETTMRGGKAKGRALEKEDDTDLAEVDGVETELEDTSKGRGSIASALGALNAAHANENALANASPNSRVGRIAAYRDEVLNGQMAEEELEDAAALLDSLEEPDRTTEEIAEDLTAEELEELAATIEEIEAAETEAEAEELLDGLSEVEREYYDAQTYEAAEDAVEDLTEEVENSEELQMDLLEAAANKEVTDEVVEEVNRLLGIEETEEVAATGEEVTE